MVYASIVGVIGVMGGVYGAVVRVVFLIRGQLIMPPSLLSLSMITSSHASGVPYPPMA